MATQTLVSGGQLIPRLYEESTSRDENQSGQYLGRIALKSRGRTLLLPVSHVCWIGAEENYVRICIGNESHLLRETMSSIEQRLDPKQFLRVHRSAIVNLRFVRDVQNKTRGECAVHLVNGQKLPMSRSYRARVGELLSRYVLRSAPQQSEQGVQ
jgi:two-component system LytT family response regulator